MKKNFKKVIAYSVTMLMVLSSLPAAYMSAETTSEYNISQDLDASGKWKYRNLAPGEGEESSTPDAAGYVCYRNDSGYVSINKDTENKVDGSYSWKADLGAGQRVNVFLDTSIQLNKEYYLSTWIKQDYSAQDFLNMAIYTKYKLQGDEAATETLMPPADGSGRNSFEIAKDDWVHYQNKFKLTVSDDGKTEDTSYKSPLGIMNITENSTQVNVNLDDLSFRLIPDWSVNAIDAETLVVNGKNVARWTFDKDIEKWTCTKNLFTAEGCDIDDVTVTTDETTRKTILDVSYTMDGVVGSITLPEGIKDAWGRDIVGITDYQTMSVSTVTTTYDSTAESEVDASGKWKYRNLAPGEGEESSTPDAAGYVCYRNDSGYVSINEDTENKVDGNYSWKADLKGEQRVNVFLDTSIQLNKEYYLSTWIKQDYSAKDFLNMTIYTKYKLQGDEAATEKLMPPADGSGRNSFDIQKGDWVHYQNKFKLTASDDGKTEDTNYKSPLGIMNITDTSTRVNVNLDDLSFRLIPDWSVNAIDAETLVVNGKNVARWTFDKDIEKWTCTKDLFSTENCTIDDVVVTTDERTRITTLDVAYTTTGAGEATITLPTGIKDAWGREIEDIDNYDTISIKYGIDKTSGSFYYDISDITSETYTVIVASYADSRLVDVTTIASEDLTDDKAEGEVTVAGADKVVFYVWEDITNTLKPLVDKEEYIITQ